jgi:hypothetical protein
MNSRRGGNRLNFLYWFGIYYVYYLQGSVYLFIVPVHSNHQSHVAWVKFQRSRCLYPCTFVLSHLPTYPWWKWGGWTRVVSTRMTMMRMKTTIVVRCQCWRGTKSTFVAACQSSHLRIGFSSPRTIFLKKNVEPNLIQTCSVTHRFRVKDLTGYHWTNKNHETASK